MNSENEGISRRSLILQYAPAAAALAAVGIAPVVALSKGTDPGPGNPDLDAQNSDSKWPPGTDSKSLVQNFKYPF